MARQWAGRTNPAKTTRGAGNGRSGGSGVGSNTMRNPFAAPVTKKTYESDGAPFLPVGTGTVLKEPSQRSAPSSGGSSGGGGTGGGSIGYFGGNTFGGGGGGGSAPAPVVTAPSKEDYLAGDSGFQTQKSALLGALERYLSDVDFQRSTYTTDYGKSLRDLGYDEGQGTWNWEDPITASGRGYQNQLNDFAGRNMLQSQGYADAFNELQRMLGQQYDALSGAKTTFMTDLDNQTANYKAENTASQQAARAEALQRRAAQYGL